jgi:hypothetical protein
VLDIIPSVVFGDVQTHLRERSREAQSGWESASEEEDALTGDFCGSLRTGWREAQASDGRWRWKVQYKKFRGRGDGALEKHIGADGLVQVEVHTPSGVVITKGVLFQAKKVRGSSRSDLREQVEKMEGVAPGGSAIFEFGPDGYRATAGSVVIREIHARPTRIPHPTELIGEYLADQFLPCRSGLRGMYYDAVRENLIVPVDGAIRVIAASLRHRLRIDIVHESQVGNVEERYE